MKIYNENELEELVKILKNDGVIGVPTDTVYGVCACMNSKKAYENLLIVKNRPASNLFPVMCANIEQIKSIAIANETAEKIILNFMPGPITIVLKKQPSLPGYVTNFNETIAVRMATSKVLKELILKVGSPLFMTSANQSGEPVCKSVEEIQKACPKLDGILDGTVSFNVASTIIDCSSNEIKILREGPIKMEELQKKLN